MFKDWILLPDEAGAQVQKFKKANEIPKHKAIVFTLIGCCHLTTTCFGKSARAHELLCAEDSFTEADYRVHGGFIDCLPALKTNCANQNWKEVFLCAERRRAAPCVLRGL